MSHDENPEEPQQPHFLTGIHRYLASLSPQTLRRLFDTPSTCLAIFRCAPDCQPCLSYLNSLLINASFTDSLRLQLEA